MGRDPRSAKALDAVSKSRAFIYGSLAGRSPYNLEQLDRLLDLTGPMKFFDVNLRPPFVDPPLVMDLARRADVLKLNDGEVGQFAHWVRTGIDPGHARDERRSRAIVDARGSNRRFLRLRDAR